MQKEDDQMTKVDKWMTKGRQTNDKLNQWTAKVDKWMAKVNEQTAKANHKTESKIVCTLFEKVRQCITQEVYTVQTKKRYSREKKGSMGGTEKKSATNSEQLKPKLVNMIPTSMWLASHTYIFH